MTRSGKPASMGPLNGLNAFNRHNRTNGAAVKLAESAAEVSADHVMLEVEGIDRMYRNVYVPQLQCEHGVVQLFREQRKQAWASSALMNPISRRLVGSVVGESLVVDVHRLPEVPQDDPISVAEPLFADSESPRWCLGESAAPPLHFRCQTGARRLHGRGALRASNWARAETRRLAPARGR